MFLLKPERGTKFYSRCYGLSLIELLVSMAIGVTILAGVVQMYAMSTTNAKTSEGASVIQEVTRYVTRRIKQDVAHAGYMGCFDFFHDHDDKSNQEGSRLTSILADKTLPGELYDYRYFIDGENNSGPGINGADSTDSLILRFISRRGRVEVTDGIEAESDAIQVDTEDSNYQSLKQFQIAMLGNCSRAAIFMITNEPDGDGRIEFENGIKSDGINKDQYNNGDIGINVIGTKEKSKIIPQNSPYYLYSSTGGAVIYDIQTSVAGTLAGEVCGADTPQYCALYRDDEELVEGVEDFQVEYGYESGGNLVFADADTVPSVPSDMWTMIDRVRITITANSVQLSPSNDGNELSRKTFTQVFALNNQLGLDQN